MVSGMIASAALTGGSCMAQRVPVEGFLPMVGIGLTDEFQTLTEDLLFSVADLSGSPGGTFLGAGNVAHYDVALFDTGANGSLLTDATDAAFGIQAAGFRGTTVVQIGGATGTLNATVNDPVGIYATGLANRAGSSPLDLDTGTMVGQTSVALLKIEPDSDLPNVLGLPFASQYTTIIRSDQPQIFDLGGKTVRTPQIEFLPLGSGGQGITRRAPLMLNPGASFVSPPAYIPDFSGIINGLPAHDNPTSHTLHSDGVLSVGGMFLSVDVANGGEEIDDSTFFFDTGASVTVVSELNAVRLGFDPVLDEPEFTVAVVGSGGTALNVPGFFVDEFSVATVGGTFTVSNVPVIVLNVTDASDPANIVDGIVGMNVFAGRNLVIDPKPSLGGGGIGPQLYISDPVIADTDWTSTAANESWSIAGNWSANEEPDVLNIVNVRHVSGGNQVATIGADAVAWEVNVSGAEQQMELRLTNGARLTTFSGTNVEPGGVLHIESGALDTQYVDIRGGTLSGQGHIATGSGPIAGQVENAVGTVAPGEADGGIGAISIEGRFSNGVDGTLAFDIGGLLGGVHHDQLHVDGDVALDGTLDVDLVDLDGVDYQPANGHEFTLLSATAGLGGQFEQLFLPPMIVWDLEFVDDEGLLLTVLSTLPGDFNADGMVNAADYVVWRNAEGSTISTRADADGSGLVDEGDLAIWRDNFGTVAELGAGSNQASVPEPTTFALLLVAALFAFQRVARNRG
jgi:hypothetical protein